MNAEKANKQQATLADWSIVLYPDIYKATESPETVFAKLNCGLPVALFGRAKSDPRYDAEKGDAFADGHRLVTSPIISVKDGKYHTQDTIYTLDENDKNLDFKKWCEDNQYKEIPLDGVCEKDVEQSNMLLLHICENCNKQEVLTSEDGYKQGWDKGTYSTYIGCPDSENYSGKLSRILASHNIKSITVFLMEVHCCGGIVNAVKNALITSGKMIPWNIVTISTDGKILDV